MPNVLTIGVFDGVHLGHQSLLRHARVLASKNRAQVLAIAFDPHPDSVLQPQRQPPRLINRYQKERYLLAAGADQVLILEPTERLLDQDPRVFVESFLMQYEPLAVVEGQDFRFGHQRAGDMALLEQLGEQFGFQTITVRKQQVVLSDVTQMPVSSTLTRWLIAQGRVADAERCMGRPFSLTSTVVPGDRRGRQLGFPTINLDLEPLAVYIRPAPGVYAGSATLADDTTHAACISVGNKPTFTDRQFTIEAYLLDFDGDLYGQNVTLTFRRWLRDQLPFPSVELLIEQMHRDVDATRERMALD